MSIDFNKKVLPTQLKNVINEVLTNSVIQVLQKTTSETNTIQEINNTCSATANQYVYEASLDCVNGLKKKEASNEDIIKLCTPIYTCTGKNISMKNDFKVNTEFTVTSEVKTNIENYITQNLSQTLKEKIGPFDFDSISQKIGDLTKEITNAIADINQTIVSKTGVNQILSLGNYRVDNISINIVQNIVLKKIQTN